MSPYYKFKTVVVTEVEEEKVRCLGSVQGWFGEGVLMMPTGAGQLVPRV